MVFILFVSSSQVTMPGLAGIISENVDVELLGKMTDSLLHESVHRVDRYVGSFFGIVRVHLGIFNPQAQPIFNEDGTICIFMVGRTYGYNDRMRRLTKEHKFTIGNDADYCLHAYEEQGIDFVKDLNGDFVIVICDTKKEKSILLNDRYGLRPLYYTINRNGLLFASEVKAILKDRSFKKRLRDDAIADFAAFGYLLGNKTFFENIEVLPPASILVYENQKLSIEQYWDYRYTDKRIKDEELVAELVKKFTRGVQLRTSDNYKYGVSLSGGLDSRSIAAVVRKDAMAFTFGMQGCDDERIAVCVAKRTGLMHKCINYDADMVLPYADEVVKLTDGFNIIYTSFTPYVYRKIRKYIDVSFIGLAMDLLLGGSYLSADILAAKDDNELARVVYGKKRVFKDDEFKYLFTQDHFNRINDCLWDSFIDIFRTIEPNHPGNKSDCFYLQNKVRRLTLMGHVMVRNYVEDAIPSYDNDFIDTILAIPPELRMNYRIYVKFLKQLSPELSELPYQKTMIRADSPYFLWNLAKVHLHIKKKLRRMILFFSDGKVSIGNKREWINIDSWLRVNKTWNMYCKKLLFNKDAISKEFFNENYLHILFHEHEKGKRDNSKKIMHLVTFEVFLRLIENEM